MQYLPRRGILLMCIAALGFSVMTAAGKSLSERLPVMEVVFIRALCTALLVIPSVLRNRSKISWRGSLLLLFRGAVGFTSLALGFFAFSQLTLSDAALLTQTSLLFTPLLAALLLRERLPHKGWRYLISASIGVILVIQPTWSFLNIPGFAGLLSGFLSAPIYIAIRRLQGVTPTSTIIFSFSVMSCVCSAAFPGDPFLVPETSELLPIVLLGTFGSLGQICMTSALSFAPAPLVTPYLFLQVPFAMLIGAMLWSSLPNGVSVIGSLIVCWAGVRLLALTPLGAPRAS